MSELVNRLREQRASVWEKAKELADRAAEENRAFSGEEEAQWQRLNSELDALDKRIKNVLDGEQRAKETEDAFSKLTDQPQDARASQKQGGSQDSEFRAFARGEKGRVFQSTSTRPINARPVGQRDLSVADDGNIVPTSFFDRLVEHMIETSSIMRAGATILNTGSGEDLQVPKTTAHSTASIVTEGSGISEDDPTFGQTTLGAFKYGLLIDVSRELIDDNGIDLEGYLARQAGRALGNGFGEDAITGDNSGNNPRGVVTDASVGTTGATGESGAFTAEDLIDLKFSVIEQYRRSPSCFWLMQDATLAQVRKLRDESGGSAGTGGFLWQPALVAGEPDQLLGHRIITDPYVPAVADDAKSVVFGDMSAYFVRLAGGVRWERSEDFNFDSDLVTFRALMRADGKLIDLTGAVKVFEGGSST